jgi:hypothetical protein
VLIDDDAVGPDHADVGVRLEERDLACEPVGVGDVVGVEVGEVGPSRVRHQGVTYLRVADAALGDQFDPGVVRAVAMDDLAGPVVR